MKKVNFIVWIFFATCKVALSQTSVVPSENVPIGTIVAWAGNKTQLPDGWLICNGDKIAYGKYHELCEILSDRWGPTTVDNNVIKEASLPDLRGMFLRGVNEQRNDVFLDPDANNRIYINSKQPSSFRSNEVGSYQRDSIASHTHKSNLDNKTMVSYGSNGSGKADWTGGSTILKDEAALKINNEGGNETRPNNAYVYWIIKAR